MRRVITFACAGETLIGTLDEGSREIGLLVVSGGNEVRAGAHRGMAMLAARLAADGVPVFRFDRRGTGDSTGENTGYASSRDDIAAAARTFRAEAGIARVIGFGNCDAATALALFGREAGIDAIVLANPWVIETPDNLPPRAAILRRYAQRLRRPWTWARVDLRRLVAGVRKLARREPRNLALRVATALAAWGDDARIILASGDATAIAFAAAIRTETPVTHVDTASHSFASREDAAALEQLVRTALT